MQARRHKLDRLKELLLREDGPTTTEYAIMIALIIVVAVSSIGAVGGKVSTYFDRCGSASW